MYIYKECFRICKGMDMGISMELWSALEWQN